MKNKLYQVDAFTDKVFSGNPAAVCPLQEWLSDELLQKIAMENNLAETAFYVKDGDQYQIKWFTPKLEVDLCGHATLAAAYVLFHFEHHKSNTIYFHSHRSGHLPVTKEGEYLELNFPADEFKTVELTKDLSDCFDITPVEALRGKTDFLLVYENETQVKNLQPHLERISQLDARGVIVTAKGEETDFVSRFFAPLCGVNEDPVTGSAHTTLVPYWSRQLNKTELTACQISERKGYLHCKFLGDRVEIKGQAKLFLIGEYFTD